MKFNKKHAISRILTFPFACILIFVSCFRSFWYIAYRWFMYGGEMIPYNGVDEHDKIIDIYELLKEKK